MTTTEFDQLLETRLRKIREVLASKATEYAAPIDRLHNFKRAAAITGETPAQACVGFMAKHLASVLDLVDDLSQGHCERAALLTDEKVGDAINYLILLEALIAERLQTQGAP